MIKRSPTTRRGTRALVAVRRTTLGSLIARATEVFNRWIRNRDGRCMECGVTINLTCAHFFTAKRHSTRWDPENACALCFACHRHYTDNREAWTEWLVKRLGQEKYDEIEQRSLVAMPSWKVQEAAEAAIKTFG